MGRNPRFSVSRKRENVSQKGSDKNSQQACRQSAALANSIIPEMLLSGRGTFPAITHRRSVVTPMPSRLANWVPLMQRLSAMGADGFHRVTNGSNL